MIIIGISGKKRSGKDEVCNAITKLYPLGSVYRVAFADALKEEVLNALMFCEMPCVISNRFTLQMLENNKELFRPILQWWGTDFRRKMCSDSYWLNKWMKRVAKLPDNSVVICPDVRFDNERATIENNGGHMIRIKRVSYDKVNGNVIDDTDTHASECDLDGQTFPITILNDSSLVALELKVRQVMYQLDLNLKKQ